MTDANPEELRAHRDEMERTKNDPYPTEGPAPGRPGEARSKVLQVRLKPDEYAAVQAHAEKHGLPASTVVRGWILTRLTDGPQDALPAAVDKLAADVDRLRRLVS